MNDNITKIGVSALTASILGLKKINSKATSTQAYFMVGSNCLNNCAFCSQSKNSLSESKMLSRVSWPQYEVNQVIESLKKNEIIKKACFQVVASKDYFKNFLSILSLFKSSLDIPFGASIDVYSINQIDSLFNNGISTLGIAIDAASKEVFNRIKQKNIEFVKLLELTKEASIKYPYKITVHLIVGLGESDKDIIELFNDMNNFPINIALFAFTPVKGTKMQNHPMIDIKRYRYIQLLRQLFYENNSFNFSKVIEFINFDDKGMITDFSKKLFSNIDILEILQKGEYMKTSGCNLCNRPYYNDKPGSDDLFNYYEQPSKDIIEKWEKCIINSII